MVLELVAVIAGSFSTNKNSDCPEIIVTVKASSLCEPFLPEALNFLTRSLKFGPSSSR